MNTVLLTREPAGNRQLGAYLQQQGWLCMEQPLIHTRPLTIDAITQRHAIEHIESSQTLIVTSPNALRHCPAPVLKACNKDWKHIYVMGKGSEAILRNTLVQAKVITCVGNSEDLIQRLPIDLSVSEQNVFLLNGRAGRRRLTSWMQARGMHLGKLPVYERVKPLACKQLENIMQIDRLYLVFTCTSSLKHLFQLSPVSCYASLKTIPCVVISHRIARFAQKVGMQRIQVAAGMSPQYIYQALQKLIAL